jgi:hypothetical protein
VGNNPEELFDRRRKATAGHTLAVVDNVIVFLCGTEFDPNKEQDSGNCLGKAAGKVEDHMVRPDCKGSVVGNKLLVG